MTSTSNHYNAMTSKSTTRVMYLYSKHAWCIAPPADAKSSLLLIVAKLGLRSSTGI